MGADFVFGLETGFVTVLETVLALGLIFVFTPTFAVFFTVFASDDLSLAALFLCMKLFLTDLSIMLKSTPRSPAFFFCTILIAFFKAFCVFWFTKVRFLSCLSFFFADFVTGMGVF